MKPTFLGFEKGEMFAVAFVYREDGSTDVLSGSTPLIDLILRDSGKKCLVRYVCYNRGVVTHSYHRIMGTDSVIYILGTAKHGGSIVSSKDAGSVYLRRVPRRWIPAFGGDFTGMNVLEYGSPKHLELRGL